MFFFWCLQNTKKFVCTITNQWPNVNMKCSSSLISETLCTFSFLRHSLIGERNNLKCVTGVTDQWTLEYLITGERTLGSVIMKENRWITLVFLQKCSKIYLFQKSSLSSLKSYIRRFEWATNEGIWFWESKVMAPSKWAFLNEKVAQILYIFFYFPGEAEKIGNRLLTSKTHFLGHLEHF